MEHLVDHFLNIENFHLRGFIFGFTHVFLMMIGYYTGVSINRILKLVSKGYIAGIVGAGVAHVLGDLIASLLDPSTRPLTAGIVVGGIIPLTFIPLLEKFVTKSSKHIVVGDHEDVKKDLESH